MKTADKFFVANIERNLSRLANVRKAMNNVNGDEFCFNNDIVEVPNLKNVDFNGNYVFIKPVRSKSAIEVDSIAEAKSIFKNIE